MADWETPFEMRRLVSLEGVRATGRTLVEVLVRVWEGKGTYVLCNHNLR